MNRICVFCLTAVLIGSLPASAQDATIKEENRSFVTYPFGDPDPVPSVARNPVIYPYHAFDGFSRVGGPQTWNLVRLENRYIRALVMPSIGGKIWGAVEKGTGKEFIYMNDVVKFRRIALRGPWTSGGVEFNFGIIGHTPSTATPVDYALRTNPDGSVTCFVGTIDLPSRTRWTVAITLPKEKAYLETRAFWYNPTPYDQSYYTWTTAAVSAGEELQYFYDGRFMVPHSDEIENAPWPVDRQGRDLSFYRNNAFEGSKSYFIFGSHKTTFGTYQKGEDMGLGHWALHEDMPGQKVWIWSLFREGGIWEDLLTDRRGQYSEPQAGRLLSQVDHEFFSPYRGDTWKELWFPVKGTGGLTTASPYAVLYLEKSGDSLRLRLSALQSVNDVLTVINGGRIVYQKRVVLKPLALQELTLPWTDELATASIRLGDKLSYDADPGKRELSRPLVYSRPPASTPEGHYLAGEFCEKRRQYEEALNEYLACIHEEPYHVRALSRVAGLYGRRGEAAMGLDYAARALAVSKYDPASNYWFGVLSRQSGRLADAKETFGWAARSLEFRSAAYAQMAEIALQERQFGTAAEYALTALDYNKYDVNASLVLAVARRKEGRRRDASAVLDGLLAFDPLNHQARFERYLLDPGPARLREFTGMIRTELPHETYLEAAIWYARIGCGEESLKLLSVSPSHPMIRFWRAYLLREVDPAMSAQEAAKAEAMSPELVFPFREESIPVLQWAAARATSWKPKYYAGLILWHKGRLDEAAVRFNDCGDPDDWVFHTARAMLREQTGAVGVRADLERSRDLSPASWRSWHYLVRHLQKSGRQDEALQHAEEAASHFPDSTVTRMDLALSLFQAGKFARCLSVLESMHVLPYEGSWEAHDLYVRANLNIAFAHLHNSEWNRAIAQLEASKAFPENLGTGKPYDPDYRLQDYLIAYAFEKLGRAIEAAGAREEIQSYTVKHGVDWGSYHYFGLRTLQVAGEKKAAADLLKSWETRNPDDPFWLWNRARADGNVQGMLIIENKNRIDPGFSIQREALRAIGE